MIYDAADRAIREMNRADLKAFGRLKMAKWDEIRVIREVKEVYASCARLAKKKFREVFEDAFFWMLLELGYEEAKAKLLAEGESQKAVEEMLNRADPVTLYVFAAETERKQERLIEAIAAAHDKGREVDKALRYWTRQVAQYADNSVFQGRLRAMERAGVRRVMWNTQDDERVCGDCNELDGQVFDIEHVPDTPHWGCRCFLTRAD